jgi:hypothetical protein
MRVWLFTFFLCVGVSGAYGQIRYQLGFTAGVNYSSLRSDQFTTASGVLAPVIGCSFVVAPNNRFELNQEIVLTIRGAKARAVYFRPEQKPEEHTYTYKYYTFETGLFAGFRPGRDLPILLQAGGYFGANFHTLNRSQRELMIVDYEDINNATRAVDLNDAFAGLDYGPALGLMLGEGRFRANARYYFGMKNLYNYIDFVAPGPRIRTNALRVTLTYFLE